LYDTQSYVTFLATFWENGKCATGKKPVQIESAVLLAVKRQSRPSQYWTLGIVDWTVIYWSGRPLYSDAYLEITCG